MKGEHIVYELAEKLDDSYAIVMIGRKTVGNVPARIINLPRTQNVEELVKWYSAADVFVNPTLGDNFPTVNIEALACGTPIVTNNTGGSPEIAGNEYGRIVYSKTADEFVMKINECLLADISVNDCRNASLRFARDACFEQYMDVYRSVLKATEK
jgi:glycosyltransferase involved in cell wall biosynthesis